MKQLQATITNNSLATSLREDGAFRAKVLQGIFIGFGFFALLYVMFLGSAVFNIVARKSLDAQAHELTNQIGELELNYLQVSGSIDRTLSKEMGFQEISQNFATRNALTLNSYELARNEI